MQSIDLIDLEKRAQKVNVQRVASKSMVATTQKNKKNVKKSGKSECSSVKEKLANVSDTLSGTLKGQFSKKVKESFKKQAEKIDNF